MNYNWLDQSPVAGTNSYRIKGIGEDGSVRYSNDAGVQQEQHLALAYIQTL
ncbi:MAG: hypothetical protein WDM71_06180 [Ferruginibacter sp.]